MADKLNWKPRFDEYVKQSEPEKAQRSLYWKTAIGLQDVDGLKPSEYLLETACRHIEGEITIGEAQGIIGAYYEQSALRKSIEESTKEADIVSVRIAGILGEKAFNFSPAQLTEIHRRLFEDVFPMAGKIRDYNISKKEWVLGGESVTYASFESIRATLDYDFATEKNFSYAGLNVHEIVRHISRFTSDIWQIHPFPEGNTRATSVFIIKYLNSFGFDITNEAFAENSWYFRNALVRANYNDFAKGIFATTEFLEKFFENLLLNKNNPLKNRELRTIIGCQ